MSGYRRFDSPIIKSAFTPPTWAVPDINTPTTLRLKSALRRITPHTIKEAPYGMIESPFGPPSHELFGMSTRMSSYPTKKTSPFTYSGAVSIPGGAMPKIL